MVCCQSRHVWVAGIHGTGKKMALELITNDTSPKLISRACPPVNLCYLFRAWNVPTVLLLESCFPSISPCTVIVCCCTKKWRHTLLCFRLQVVQFLSALPSLPPPLLQSASCHPSLQAYPQSSTAQPTVHYHSTTQARMRRAQNGMNELLFWLPSV